MLTQENIDKLIRGRSIIDEYNLNINKYGWLNYLTNKLNEDLNEFKNYTNTGEVLRGFNLFDYRMVLFEIDECYRVRHKKFPEIPFICDDCEGRSVKCYEWRMSNYDCSQQLVSQNKSKIYKELLEYSITNNIDMSNKPVGNPLLFLQLLDFEGNLPLNCNGFFLKIKEPQFELLWQSFSEQRNIGNIFQKWLDKQNILKGYTNALRML